MVKNNQQGGRRSPIIEPNLKIKQTTLDDEHWDVSYEGSTQNKKN